MGYYDLTYDGQVVQAIADTANDLRLNGYIFKGTIAAGNVSVTSAEPSWWVGGPGSYGGAFSANIPEGSVGVFALKNGTWLVTVVEVVGNVTLLKNDVSDLNFAVFGGERWEDIPYNYISTTPTAVIPEWIGIIKNGDMVEFSCNAGYLAYAFTTNADATEVVHRISDGYQSSFSGLYTYDDGERFRILIRKDPSDDITEQEALANVDFSLSRMERGGGLVDEKPTINALFVGNSVSQDHVAYLPWLLKNTYGDDVKFRICIAYKASYTIAGYVSDICTGNVNLDIFSVADNVQGWTNTNNYPWANIWTNYGHFDLICFEGYFNHGSTSAGMVEDPTKFADFISDLKSRQTEPFKLGYLMHQTYTTSTHTEADAWARITGGAEYAIQHNPVSILFPCGAVTKLVNGAIPQSFLTNDNTHNQQGLPCIMGAYVLMEELARYVGLPSKILNNPLRIDSATDTALNVPGPNGSLKIGTDAQYAICQDAAVQSVKWGDNLMIINSGGIL